MKRILIAYHSRSGHTRRVAQALAARLGADLEEIRIVQPLDGVLGYVMCAIESLAALTPALRPAQRNPAAYDLVVVGTPVWFWDVASPVRSWLERYPLERPLAFFCTMGASGGERAFATMGRLVGRAPLATLALRERDLEGSIEPQVDGFVRHLHSAVAARPPRAAGRPRAAPAAA